MIFRRPPVGFSPRFELVQCYLEHDGRFLLLKRLPEKSEGGKWGIPAGKVEKDEPLEEAMVRELREETQIRLTKTDLLQLGSVYVRYPDYDFKSHMFFASLSDMPAVTICPNEHSDFQWLSLESVLDVNLVRDQDKSFKIFSNLRKRV